jgi:hypothetical protein
MLTDQDISELVAAAGDVALMFAGIDEQQMMAALYDIREHLKTRMEPTVGAEFAKMIGESFAAAVILRRREIEADGAISRQLN